MSPGGIYTNYSVAPMGGYSQGLSQVFTHVTVGFWGQQSYHLQDFGGICGSAKKENHSNESNTKNRQCTSSNEYKNDPRFNW